MPLANRTAPELPALPEADTSDMENFISQARIVLPVLGVNLLRGQGTSPAPTGARRRDDSPVFTMAVPKSGGVARAREIDGEFTVLAGSHTRSEWVGREPKGGRPSTVKNLRQSLVAKGVIAAGDGGMVFVKDQVFTSPSTAAAVVVGTETHNGRQAWKVEATRVTYGEWQAQEIQGAEAGDVKPEAIPPV
ncbi:MAG: DUF4357 domain-containing protein [Bifidobacteriaceae bacterium]|jgi:hypothetical protein|nr:DUF4357 domain-containing protein [Bifidobacteriaceae bacterium]